MRACHGVITIDYRLTTDSLSRQYSVENHHLFVAIEDQISPSRPILILILRDARALSKWKPPVYPSRTLSNLKGRRNEYSPESNSSRLRTHGNLFQCIQVDVTYGDRTWTAPKMLNDQWSMINIDQRSTVNSKRSLPPDTRIRDELAIPGLNERGVSTACKYMHCRTEPKLSRRRRHASVSETCKLSENGGCKLFVAES